MENLRKFFVDPRIDKPWGNTPREKLHKPCACGIQIGALRRVNNVSLHRDDSALRSQVDRYANERLDQISDAKLSVNAPQDESPQDKDNRRRRNCRCAARRRNATTRDQQGPVQHGPRNLWRDFNEAADNAFCSPLINLAEAAILMQGLLNTLEIRQIQRLTRDALHQIGRQHLDPSVSHNS